MLHRTRTAAALAVVTALLVVPGRLRRGVESGGSAVTHPKLIGVVGKNNAFKITLSSKGKVAKTLKAGTYTVVIHDDSTIHNYELDGPHGKSWTFTSVGSWARRRSRSSSSTGKYKAYCAPHESIMFQHFTVKVGPLSLQANEAGRRGAAPLS